MKCESELKSQQIKTYDANITHLSEEIKTLSNSLQEKEATAAQIQSQLQTYQHIASTPEQLLVLLKSVTQIAELECKLQKVEYQKQQAELEREAAVQEMKAKENLKLKLHAQLGKQWTSYKYSYFIFSPPAFDGFLQMNHPKSLTIPKAWAKFAQEQMFYLLSKPREQILCITSGSGSQLKQKIGVITGGHVILQDQTHPQ